MPGPSSTELANRDINANHICTSSFYNRHIQNIKRNKVTLILII